MVMAVVIAALGGILAGHWIRNGWAALLLLVALVGVETSVVAWHYEGSPLAFAGAFVALDTVGSAALLLGGALAN